jgi:hypothetical protein
MQYDKLRELFSKFSADDNGKILSDLAGKSYDKPEQQKIGHEYHQMVNGNRKIMNNKRQWDKNGKY